MISEAMRFQYLNTALIFLVCGLCQGQTISTVAGSDTAGFAGDGGPASTAQINSPQGLSFDSTGNLYFADSANQRIRVIGAVPSGSSLSTGSVNTVAGNGMGNLSASGAPVPPVTGPALSDPLDFPFAVLALPSGGFYFADYDYIYSVTSAGVLSYDNTATTDVQQFALDPQGNVYGFSLDGSSVFRYTFGSANYVSVAGNVNMAGDSGDGGPATSALFTTISAIASDASGNIYVTDSGACRIRKFKVGGTITTVAGNGTCGGAPPTYGKQATAVELDAPTTALAVDGNGNIYFDDGNRIEQVNASGVISHFAGIDSGSAYVGEGGPAIDAYFAGPNYLVVDSGNNLYLSSPLNRILMISAACVTNCPPPVVTPVIGGVSSAATNKQTITPGDWVSIYGTNLATVTGGILPADINGAALPTALNGVSVTVDGIPATVSYTSPGQVNIEIPDDTTIGSVPVVLTYDGVASASFPIPMAATSASLFGYYSGSTFLAVAQHLDYSLVTSTAPAAVGETIILYADGLGTTNPPVTSGTLYSGAAPLVDTATVSIGGVPGTVSFAGIIGAGLYQLNIVVPQVAAGNQSIVVTLTSGGTTVDMTQSGVVLPVQ
jgi:uncharacterized protein (TIGR03437 family)